MDAVDMFQAPLILRMLCYLAGMAVFLCEGIWLGRLAYGRGSVLSLRECVVLWCVRIVTATALLSLGGMLMQIEALAGKVLLLPEIFIVLLAVAFYHMMFRRSGHHSFKALVRAALAEILKIAGLLLLTVAGWAVLIALGWAMFLILQPGFAIFIIGLLANGSLVFLYFRAVKREPGRTLEFQKLLWPVLLAYILLMLPDLTEQLGNSEKIRQMMDPSPPLIRV